MVNSGRPSRLHAFTPIQPHFTSQDGWCVCVCVCVCRQVVASLPCVRITNIINKKTKPVQEKKENSIYLQVIKKK